MAVSRTAAVKPDETAGQPVKVAARSQGRSIRAENLRAVEPAAAGVTIETDGTGIGTEQQLLAGRAGAVDRVTAITVADTTGVKALAASELNTACQQHSDKKNADHKLKPVAECP